jgi:hypothetical protein
LDLAVLEAKRTNLFFVKKYAMFLRRKVNHNYGMLRGRTSWPIFLSQKSESFVTEPTLTARAPLMIFTT